MKKQIIFSAIIPASQKDLGSEKLKDLIASIKNQDFPQDQIEILVITEGDSESAKAIGIRKAKGDICVMFCADNSLIFKETFSSVYQQFKTYPISACYGRFYACVSQDNSLNRYFSLIGGNDVICYYLGKNDRKPWFEQTDAMDELMWFRGRKIPSLGCNGTFINRKQWIENADLDHYYPMDCAVDVINKNPALFLRRNVADIWHRTSDNLITFLKKRYKYARDLYSDRNDRRWKIIGSWKDKGRLFLFILATLTMVEPLLVSVRGYRAVRDPAWFWHWPVCVGFLITYGILTCRNILKLALSSRHLNVLTLLKDALSPSGIKHSKITR